MLKTSELSEQTKEVLRHSSVLNTWWDVDGDGHRAKDDRFEDGLYSSYDAMMKTFQFLLLNCKEFRITCWPACKAEFIRVCEENNRPYEIMIVDYGCEDISVQQIKGE